MLKSRKFQDMFFGNLIAALVFIFWGRFFSPEPAVSVWSYFGEVFTTMFVFFNGCLWCERIWLACDFNAVPGEVLSRRAVILGCIFVIGPIVVLTGVIPTPYAPPFGRNLFWMAYIGLGIGLWVWNISTKLLTPKPGKVAVTDNGEKIEAGKIIHAPLFGSINSLPRVIPDQKKRC